MAVHWYQCKHCDTLIKKDSSPSNAGCLKKNSHSWTKLAELGSTNYQCRKCGTTIQASGTPISAGCSAASSHSWTKL